MCICSFSWLTETRGLCVITLSPTAWIAFVSAFSQPTCNEGQREQFRREGTRPGYKAGAVWYIASKTYLISRKQFRQRATSQTARAGGGSRPRQTARARKAARTTIVFFRQKWLRRSSTHFNQAVTIDNKRLSQWRPPESRPFRTPAASPKVVLQRKHSALVPLIN